MKMAILELEYKNIRKITALKLPFTKADGSVISNNFIMMANGTGKTTTMELIKGLFDGTAAGWTASKVRSFAPTLTEADTGEFSTTVKFDDRQYKYFLSMNYKDGTVQVETSAPPKGREAGLRLPESRLEGAVPVPGHLDVHLTQLGLDGLLRVAVAVVSGGSLRLV